MKIKILIFLILIFYFLLFPLSKSQAQTTTLLPKITITPINNNAFDIFADLLKMIFTPYQPYQEDKSTTNESNLNDKSIYPSIITPSISINPSASLYVNITPDTNNLVYYPQCKGPYDNYPLPKGGTICSAGCGPTTVAMILASYVDKKINPITVVDMYKKRNYYLGRDGSYYYHAEEILKEYQFKINYVFKKNKKQAITINEVMKDYGNQIKNLQNQGWTFFSLADFKQENGREAGHYFWVVKFDDNLNTWAYDPFYKITDPKPINHKSLDPKFRVVMALKK